LDVKNNLKNNEYNLKYFSEWKNNLLTQKQLVESQYLKFYELSNILELEFNILSFLSIEHVKDFERAKVNTNTISTHRLYVNQKDKTFFSSEKSLVRREFEKSGSRTVLLGGKLVGKVIIRIIDEESFLAWKKAFEAEEVWKNLGFDYVPVEPILSKNGKFRVFKTKDETYGVKYRVYTKVLGPSLKDFRAVPENHKYANYLNELRWKIINGLKSLGISHGHYHEDNFCLEYFNNDLRMYVIDFDSSSSTRPRSFWP
ncbi:MAG: hypothetical protein AABX39_04630, partial [Nanoarchaeota archaeon]